MVSNTLVNFKMINFTDKDSIDMTTASYILEDGMRANSMAKEKLSMGIKLKLGNGIWATDNQNGFRKYRNQTFLNLISIAR